MIPEEAIDAAHGVVPLSRELLKILLCAVEEVWPHPEPDTAADPDPKPPPPQRVITRPDDKKDLASTTSGSFERAAPRSGWVRFGFGLPPNVR